MFKDKLNYFFLIFIVFLGPISLTPFYQIKSEEKYDKQTLRDLNIRKEYSNIDWEEIQDEKINKNFDIRKEYSNIDWEEIKDEKKIKKL